MKTLTQIDNGQWANGQKIYWHFVANSS